MCCDTARILNTAHRYQDLCKSYVIVKQVSNGRLEPINIYLGWWVMMISHRDNQEKFTLEVDHRIVQVSIQLSIVLISGKINSEC